MPFLGVPKVEIVPPPACYRLLEPLVWVNGVSKIVVPKGFVSDLASIPRPIRWLFTGHGRERSAAIVHDYLYRKGIGTRKNADIIFRAAMKDSGVGRVKRSLMYSAVRAGGMFSWRGA